MGFAMRGATPLITTPAEVQSRTTIHKIKVWKLDKVFPEKPVNSSIFARQAFSRL
jgi:hypothetical protein